MYRLASTIVDATIMEDLEDMWAEVQSKLAIELFFVSGISKSPRLLFNEAANVNRTTN